MLISGTTPETPSGSTSTTKSGGSSGHQAADSGHPDSPEVPEVTESGSLNINPDSGHNGGPPGPPLPNSQILHESENGSVDPLGPLPPNWELAYTDKGDYFDFFREIRFLIIYSFTIFLTKNFVKSCLFPK